MPDFEATIGLLLAAVLPYMPALRGPFLFDDPTILDSEPHWRSGNTPFRHWPSCLTDRCLTFATYYWTWRLWGFRPAAYHLGNFAIHAGNVLLFWRLLLASTVDSQIAFRAAVLFAVHPLASASVCYISGRAGLLVIFFALCGLHHAVAGAWHWPLALLSQWLALKSKQDAWLYLLASYLTLPFLVARI